MTSVDNGRAVIFDLDGVLIDTCWAHWQSWHDLARREGFEMPEEFFRSTFGMQSPEVLAMLLGPDKPVEKLKALAEWKETRYRQIIADKLEPADGVRLLLEDLKNRNFRVAVGSSTPRVNVSFLIERIGVQDYFDELVSEEDVTKGKPAPDTFLKAAEKLSLPPDRCVVVEDAVKGVAAGKAAGMPVVAVTTTWSRAELTQADVIVDSLTEIGADDFIRLLSR